MMDDRRITIGEELTRQVVAWVRGMGWRCCFIENDFKVTDKYTVFHSDYGEGYIEALYDGADLVRPGGPSGYILLLEQEWHFYDDGSAEDDHECPALAIRQDIADALIADLLPEPPYNCTDEEFRRHEELFSAAHLGEMSFWRDKRHLIPPEEWHDERGLAWLDRHQHSPGGIRLLRDVLLRRRGPR